MRLAVGQFLSPLIRLILETAVLLIVYLGMLLFIAGEKSFYLDLLRALKEPLSTKENDLIPAQDSNLIASAIEL